MAGRPGASMESMSEPTVSPVTDASFDACVLEADGPVVVDFTAPWCAPCRILSPHLAELAEMRPDVQFVEVNVESEQHTAAQFGVLSMPTLMVFQHGEAVLKLVGARPLRRLISDLAPAIGEVITA